MICLALPHVQSFALPVDIVEGEMRNLAGSLTSDHAILILGSAAADDEPTGLALGRRGAAELKALLERHFHVILCFSMVRETLHPGVVRAADYAFALGCGRKAPL